MIERKSYKGTLNGIAGVWTDKKPRGIKLDETIIFYTPDEGRVFERNGEYFDCVIISEGVNIDDYNEIDAPQTDENEGE